VWNGKHQEFTVKTTGDTTTQQTRCELKNEEGKWKILANAATSIHRDGNEMTIDCENESQTGSGSVEPSFNGGWLALDIVWDACIITLSCVIDGTTNAWYSYPDSTTIEMKDKASL
jgi:hypothetical protein